MLRGSPQTHSFECQQRGQQDILRTGHAAGSQYVSACGKSTQVPLSFGARPTEGLMRR